MEVDFSFQARFQHVFLEYEHKRSLSSFKSLNEKKSWFFEKLPSHCLLCITGKIQHNATRECEIFKRQDLTIYSQVHSIVIRYSKACQILLKVCRYTYLGRNVEENKILFLPSNGWFLVASLYQCLNLIQCDIYT